LVKKKKKKKRSSNKRLVGCIIFLVPAIFILYFFVFQAWAQLKTLPVFEQIFHEKTAEELVMENFDLPMPLEYVPIYQAAAETYNVPWTLLAAHHRVETRFSTMKTDVSPVGAEGPMQFMPCTFVGWSHPSCEDLGVGDIPNADKTNPSIIAKYGGYGVDGNYDGVADPFNLYDAMYSAAKFLSIAGVKDGDLPKAIYQYNHSYDYVADILYYYELYTSYEDELLALVQ
jgi:peptidoglycan LD-endopeptidase LytH